MLDDTSRWSHACVNRVVPYRWQATKVVKPQDFKDLEALEERLLAFQDRYNRAAIPFNWRFGRKSLDELLERLATHENLSPKPSTNFET